MITQYFQDLLKTNNRVIIPNFGAFLVRATSKHKDAEDLSLKLPDIYFSPFLKFNDELLVKYIVGKEKISKEEALKKINNLVEEIKGKIEKGEPYPIKGFGEFIIDKQGKVQFTPETKTAREEKPEEEKPKEPTTEKKEQESKEKQVKPKKEESIPTKEPVKKPEEVKQQEEKREPVVPKPEKKKEPVPKPKSQQLKKEPLKHTPPPIAKPKKLNRGLILSIAIGVPLAAIFILAILNYDLVKEILNLDKQKTEQVKQSKAVPKETKKEESKTKESKQDVPAVEPKKEAVQKTVQQQGPREKKYYIIAGSFRNENYADKFMTDLIQKGYKAEKLPERNGMFAVSYNSFKDKRKALAELNYLTKEKSLTAWLLYY